MPGRSAIVYGKVPAIRPPSLKGMSAKPSDVPPGDLHTGEEIAAFLKLGPKTVFNWVNSGIILDAFGVGKTARFSLEVVKASLEMKCPAMG